MPASWVELVELLAVAILREYQHPPASITIEFSDGMKPLSIPVDRIIWRYGPAPAPVTAPVSPPAPAPTASTGPDPAPPSPLAGDILDVLRKAGKPLTKILIWETLEKAGKRYGGKSLDKQLELFLEDGTLVFSPNPSGKGRWYRFATTTTTEGGEA